MSRIIPTLLCCLFFTSGLMAQLKQKEGVQKAVEKKLTMGVSKKEKATFVHTVFFWMKEDLTEEEAKFFESEMEKLGKTPSIHSYKWGKPAGTPRAVVDNSYTYAWIVDFTSAKEQDAYQVDPIHLAFIDKCKKLWTKVQVYDTIVE